MVDPLALGLLTWVNPFRKKTAARSGERRRQGKRGLRTLSRLSGGMRQTPKIAKEQAETLAPRSWDRGGAGDNSVTPPGRNSEQSGQIERPDQGYHKRRCAKGISQQRVLRPGGGCLDLVQHGALPFENLVLLLCSHFR